MNQIQQILNGSREKAIEILETQIRELCENEKSIQVMKQALGQLA